MQYTRENLEEYGLSDLRLIGRAIGVKAPSAMFKSDLIQAILDVQSGRVTPFFSSRGRPALSKREIEQKRNKTISNLEIKVDLLLAELKKLIMSLVDGE